MSLTPAAVDRGAPVAPFTPLLNDAITATARNSAKFCLIVWAVATDPQVSDSTKEALRSALPSKQDSVGNWIAPTPIEAVKGLAAAGFALLQAVQPHHIAFAEERVQMLGRAPATSH